MVDNIEMVIEALQGHESFRAAETAELFTRYQAAARNGRLSRVERFQAEIAEIRLGRPVRQKFMERVFGGTEVFDTYQTANAEAHDRLNQS